MFSPYSYLICDESIRFKRSAISEKQAYSLQQQHTEQSSVRDL